MLRLLRLFAAAVVIFCAAYLLYRGYEWWNIREQRKALFSYLLKQSLVTKRMPEDAIVFADFYDLKRVHGSLQTTLLYSVFTHWLDTGFTSGQKSNSLLGGMLEKTILNVIGKEFSIAAVPGKIPDRYELCAVADLVPGSDLLLNLALASAKHVEKQEIGNQLIYSFSTRSAHYPKIYAAINSNFALASTELSRLQNLLAGNSNGPDFLKSIPAEAIPSDTFLLLETRNPQVQLIGFGGGSEFHLNLDSNVTIPSHLPTITAAQNDVLTIETNGSEILRRPAVGLLLDAVNQRPETTYIFNFASENQAKIFADKYQSLQEADPPNLSLKQNRDLLVLTNSSSSSVDRFHAFSGNLPLTVRVQFSTSPIAAYDQKVRSGDWSWFDQAKEFYFLSCIQAISGGIDSHHNEIALQLKE